MTCYSRAERSCWSLSCCPWSSHDFHTSPASSLWWCHLWANNRFILFIEMFSPSPDKKRLDLRSSWQQRDIWVIWILLHRIVCHTICSLGDLRYLLLIDLYWRFRRTFNIALQRDDQWGLSVSSVDIYLLETVTVNLRLVLNILILTDLLVAAAVKYHIKGWWGNLLDQQSRGYWYLAVPMYVVD